MSYKLQTTHATTTPIHLDLRDADVRATFYETYAALRSEKPVAPGILTVSDQDDADFWAPSAARSSSPPAMTRCSRS